MRNVQNYPPTVIRRKLASPSSPSSVNSEDNSDDNAEPSSQEEQAVGLENSAPVNVVDGGGSVGDQGIS